MMLSACYFSAVVEVRGCTTKDCSPPVGISEASATTRTRKVTTEVAAVLPSAYSGLST